MVLKFNRLQRETLDGGKHSLEKLLVVGMESGSRFQIPGSPSGLRKITGVSQTQPQKEDPEGEAQPRARAGPVRL